MFERRFWDFWRLQIHHMFWHFREKLGKDSSFSRKYRSSLFQKSHFTGMARSLALEPRCWWFLHQKMRAYRLWRLAKSLAPIAILPLFPRHRSWETKNMWFGAKNPVLRPVDSKRVKNHLNSETNSQDLQTHLWKSERRRKICMLSASISSYSHFAESVYFCNTIFYASKIWDECFQEARSLTLELRFQ